MHDSHSGSSAAHGGHEEHGDHGGLGKYFAVFVALCVLTLASFTTYFDFWREHMPPQVGWAFMLAVACTKAMLVILFFMHLKYEADWKYVLTIPASIMSIFLVLALVPDVGLRAHGFYPFSAPRQAATATSADTQAMQSVSQARMGHGDHGADGGHEADPHAAPAGDHGHAPTPAPAKAPAH